MPLAIILAVTAAGASGFFAGVELASNEARARVQYWATLGAAAATLYLAWRAAR